MKKKQLLESLRKNNFDEKIIKAISEVKREEFIPLHLRHLTYEDIALPLEKGATISQPYTIAFMLQLLDLERNQKILEIGSGSGYVLALISEIIKKGKIYGIEIISNLAESSRRLLKKDKKIRVFNQDGSNGLPKYAPFDRILISAAAQEIPEHLFSQLKDNGILVAPVRDYIFQIKNEKGKIKARGFPGFVFVPLKNEKL